MRGSTPAWPPCGRSPSAPPQVERTLAALDPERVTDEYKRAKRGGADPELEAVLAQRFGSVQRLLNTLDDTDERLRLLDARLGAAVAGAAEVALGASGAGGADRLDAELDGVVDRPGRACGPPSTSSADSADRAATGWWPCGTGGSTAGRTPRG